MTDDKAKQRTTVVMRERDLEVWRFDEQTMTEREVAIYNAAFKAGQEDVIHRFMHVLPSNSVYRRWPARE